MAYWSVRAALASLRGLVARYRGCSNVRRRDQVHGNRWQSRFCVLAFGTTVMRCTNATNSNTNMPNKDENNAAPSVRPHYRAFVPTTGHSAPALHVGTLVLTVLAA